MSAPRWVADVIARYRIDCDGEDLANEIAESVPFPQMVAAAVESLCTQLARELGLEIDPKVARAVVGNMLTAIMGPILDERTPGFALGAEWSSASIALTNAGVPTHDDGNEPLPIAERIDYLDRAYRMYKRLHDEVKP